MASAALKASAEVMAEFEADCSGSEELAPVSGLSVGDLLDSAGTSAAGDLLGSAGACASARTEHVTRSAKTKRSLLNEE
jgi:hypothetical protein